MQNDMSQLSENELQEVIVNAEKALRVRVESKRKEVIVKIKELAASADLSVEIREGKRSPRKGMKVPPKYRNPENPSQEWTGRGMQPGWIKSLLNEGYSLEQIEIK